MQKFKPHEFYMIQGARLCAHRGPCEQRVQTTGSRGEVDVYSTGLHHQWLSNHEQSPRSTSAPFTEIIYRSAHRRDTIFRVTVHRARMQCDVPTGIKEFFIFFLILLCVAEYLKSYGATVSKRQKEAAAQNFSPPFRWNKWACIYRKGDLDIC